MVIVTEAAMKRKGHVDAEKLAALEAGIIQKFDAQMSVFTTSALGLDDQVRFIGFCSDSARLYDGKAEACVDFATYRKLKNIALWESADGAFDAYPSCELAPDAVRAASAVRIAVERKGTITQLVCDYGGGVRFTHRTRAACRVEGAGTCDTPEACRAVCE